MVEMNQSMFPLLRNITLRWVIIDECMMVDHSKAQGTNPQAQHKRSVSLHITSAQTLRVETVRLMTTALNNKELRNSKDHVYHRADSSSVMRS